jgi:hypothetical protein
MSTGAGAAVKAAARSRLSDVVQPLAMGAAALGAAAVVGTYSPHVPGSYPVCPSLLLTGLYCPGCGSLRATHDLWNLDLAGAWSMNPLAVVALPFVIASWLAWLHRAVTGRPRRRISRPWVPNALLVVVLGYWVLRNVPVLQPYLAP